MASDDVRSAGENLTDLGGRVRAFREARYDGGHHRLVAATFGRGLYETSVA